MAKEKTKSKIDIDEDLEFQIKEWRVERAGWLAMAVIVLFALLGLFGSGPISHSTAGGVEETFHVESQRFLRFQNQRELMFTFNPLPVQEGELHLWLDSNYLHNFQIISINPQPDSVEIDQDRTFFRFKASEQVQSGQVSFIMRPQSIGSLVGRAGSQTDDGFSFTQFVFP
jgi:hypothetical protein